MPTTTTDVGTRPLPAPDRARTICQGCRRPIVWAITVAGANGRGGKMMPLDPVEDLSGRIAVTPVAGGRLTARALTAGETVDRPLEYAGIPHFATCPTRSKPDLPDNVVQLQAERDKRLARRRARSTGRRR